MKRTSLLSASATKSGKHAHPNLQLLRTVLCAMLFILHPLHSILNRCKTVLLGLLICLSASFQLKAQVLNVSWTSGYPAFSNPYIGILSEDDSLKLRFTIITDNSSGETLKTRLVRLVLPTGVTAVSAANGGNVSGTVTTGAISQSGTTWDISINSISYNQEVNLVVMLRAGSCSSPTGSYNTTVSVLSDGVVLDGSSRNIALNIVKPNITATPSDASQMLSNLNDPFTHNIVLGVSNNVSAKSMKITITKDQFTTLSDFKLGSKDITPDASSTTTSVVLNLTESIVGTATPISAANPQTLQFKAQASIRGNHSVSAICAYPQQGTACVSKNLFALTLSYATVAGAAQLRGNGVAVNQQDPETSMASTTVYDAQTVIWSRYRIINEGSAPMAWTQFTASLATHNFWAIGEEEKDIYYQINGTGAKKKVPRPYTTLDVLGSYRANDMLTKAQYVNKPRQIRFSFLDEIPANQYCDVYIPYKQGYVYDNTNWGTPPNGINTIYSGSRYMGSQSATVSGYDVNGTAVNMPGYIEGNYFGTPVFSALLSDLPIKPEEVTTANVRMIFPLASVTTNNNYSSILHIRLPKWMELYNDGSGLNNSVTFGGSSIVTGSVNSSSDADYTTYSMAVNNKDINGDVAIRYKGKANIYNYTDTEIDTIRYWIDWDSGYGLSGTARDARPLIPYHAKNIQQVSYFANQNGVTMNTLNLHRQSRGLKVHGTSSVSDSRTPEDGTKAEFSVIDNQMYLQGDTGQIIIDANMVEVYKYLYVTVNSAYRSRFNFSGLAQTGITQAKIEVSNVSSPYTVAGATIEVSGNDAWAKFTDPGTGFPVGARLLVTFPFVANMNSVTGTKGPLKVEIYASNANISNPLDPPDTNRHGEEYKTEMIGTHNRNGGLNQSYTYSTASVSGAGEVNIGTVRNTTNSSGYDYPNEYRPYAHPTTMTVIIPAGYTAGYLKLSKDYVGDASAAGPLSVTAPASTTSNADGTTTCVYNVSTLYDFTVNTYAGAQALTNKWIAPTGRMQYISYVYLTPSPLSPPLGNIQATFKYLIQPGFTEEVSLNTVTTPITYNGMRGELKIPSSTFTIYDRGVTVTSVIAGVSSTGSSGTRNSWLYIDGGNISDVSVTNKSTDQNINATGNGRWIPLGALTVNTPVEYSLKFTLNSISASNNIRVYLVADFDNNWSPELQNPVVTGDAAHLGQNVQLTMNASTNSVIQGSIAVPDTKIAYDASYNVTLSVDSRAGEADLINPEITLTVPVDQIPGTYLYEYPGGNGNWQTIPEEAIFYPSSNQITLKSSYFDGDGSSNFVLYGSRVNVTDADRTLNVRISFSAGCNTILNGFNYTASFAGKNLINGAVSGINNMISDMLTANVSSNYYFSTDLNFVSGLSFGGDSKENVLQVTVNKWAGELFDIFDTDSLIIMLPTWLNVNGAITTTSELLPGLNSQQVAPVDIVNEERSEYRRRISIKLPASVLNSAPEKAQNKPFTYYIPLVYTENARDDAQDDFLRGNPVQTVRTDVYTVIQFAPAEECFEGSVYSLGNASTDVALLTLNSPNPYLYNMLSLGENCTLEITSDGFEGSWYSNASLQGDPLSATPSYSFTPTVPGTKDLYVSAIFSGMDYGKIYLPLKIPPIELYWRKAGTDADWLNPDNWEITLNGNDNLDGYLPALSSVVTLPSPDVSTQYPVLTDTVACRIIRFEHGSELGRQDLLVYDSARVQLKIDANQWYMFSPPLHDMYSGDFYREYPDPFYDEQTAYTVRFNATNPETGETKTPSGSWTGAFNTPNVELNAGSGLAIWIDDGKEAGTHAALTFEFPKHDPEHHLYNPDRFPPGNISQTYAIDRDKNGRFIYEETNLNGNVTLPVSSSNGSVLIGNPFMAHLNFSEFYESNIQSLNSRGYKLVHGSTDIDNFYSYQWNGNKYVSTSPAGESNGLIAPMQSFIVEVKNAAGLQANIYNHTTTSVDPEDAFRDAETDASPSSRQLNILAARNTETGTEVSRAIVLQGTSHSTHYVPSEDSYKLFVSKVYDSDDVLKHVQVYTRSSDGYALDINCVGTSEQDITIPLCIRTSEKGEIVLNFSGMESFGEETAIYLYDTQYPKRLIDLSTQPEYVFDKTEDDLYLENRLSLVIGKALTQPLGAAAISESSAVRILSLSPRRLKIVSESGKALGSVRITDAWGRVVLDDSAVSSSIYEYQTPAPGVYIVRIGAEVKKAVSIR